MRELARPVALAILRRRDELLVFAVPDHFKKVTGFRPPGGTIEFGETGAETVAREIKEELGVDVVDARYVGTLENIFTYLGKPGHELARIYEVRFADPGLYERAAFDCIEANGAAFTCVWKALTTLGPDELYPAGLLALLTR
jgi:8-oxo-dGTP pyrophosphatase MutT (NUDIX family)